MTSITKALSRHSGTRLKFFNPNLEEGKQHYFLGLPPREPKQVYTHARKQGTRRYCKKCRHVMTRSGVIGRPSATIFHSSGRTGTFHEYRCPNKHTVWGQ